MNDSDRELNAATFIQKVRVNEIAREFLVVASLGFIPVEQEDLVAILAFLSGHPDQEIAKNAHASLGELPTRVLLSFAQSVGSLPDGLEALALAIDDGAVLEAIIRNRATPDDTLRLLAGRVPAMLQEVIVVNQKRIIRAPAILEALLQNPELSADVRRRALEIREEFFEKAQRTAAETVEEEDAEEAGEDLTPIADLLEQAAAIDAAGGESLPLEIPPDEVDPQRLSAWNRILAMTVSDRVQCAFRGGLTERSILIRDRNRLVCTAVVRSPRLSESEVEGYSAMRNVEEEILRIIGSKRQFTSKYKIMHNLVKNPKTPIGVVLPLINRLTLRDLKILCSDRNVSETVRVSAKKFFGSRKN